MLRIAEFHSVYDGNEYVTECVVNTKTNEIVHIDVVDTGNAKCFEGEWIVIDGKREEVYQLDDAVDIPGCYWYN